MADLSVKIGSLKLQNPVMVASGTFGYAEEFSGLLDIRKLGALVTKTITICPRKGNPPPRTCETPSGMLNSIGLENPGIDMFLKEKLPMAGKFGVPVIVSIASEKDPKELVELTRRLGRIKDVAAIELNISCPNVHSSSVVRIPSSVFRRPYSAGRHQLPLISQDAVATYNIVRQVRKVTTKTLITKLSPNVTSISDIAGAAERAGSDAIALVNTLTGLSIDVQKRQPRLKVVTGGLSGPAIRPVAVRMVWEVFNKVKIPIIGMGGIIDTSSALEFFIAGATAISVGTASFVNPRAAVEIIDGLKKYLQLNRIPNINKLTGSLQCQ